MAARREARPHWEIADVLSRTDLAALLDELAVPGSYSHRGRRWHCPMPGHDDQHPSVSLRTDRNGHERWRCWSGDDTHRGDAIDLVIATQHLSKPDAIDWLARRAGMIPDQPLPRVRQPTRPPPPEHIPLDPLVTRYVGACERILWSRSARPVREWLFDRGINEATIRANHVGADPGRSMLFRAKGLPYGATPGATFPALDHDGTVQYVQTRYLDPRSDIKYDNPSGRLGSNPRLTWTRSPEGITHHGVLLICEGPPDALIAAQAGFRSVGILGSQAPDDKIVKALAQYADRSGEQLVAVLDADQGGRTGNDRLTDMLAEHGHELTVVEPPDGLDLNDWALTDDNWVRDLAERSDVPAHGPATTEANLDAVCVDSG